MSTKAIERKQKTGTKENLAKTNYPLNITKTPIFKVGPHQRRGGMVVPCGTGWPCYFFVRFSSFLRAARPTLAVRHRLLYVALPNGLAFFKNRFWASFWAYLQITYKALNKTN